MRGSTILLAAAMLLAPAPLAAQKVEITRATATPENILKALAEGEALGNAGRYAANILIQTRGRLGYERFGPRSSAELDAFADRLVALALADPEGGDGTNKAIVEAFRSAGLRYEDKSMYTRYPGAFDALRRMYEGGVKAVEWFDLFTVDSRLTVEMGLEMLEGMRLGREEVCRFLSQSWPLGELDVADGALSFEYLDKRRSRPQGRAYYTAYLMRIMDLGKALHAAGLVAKENPCPIPGIR